MYTASSRLSFSRSLFAGLLLFCASAGGANEPLSLQELRDLDFEGQQLGLGKGEDQRLRFEALRNGALATGGQHGFAARMRELKRDYEEHAHELSSIFDFGVIMRLAAGGGEEEMFFLPPVIHEAENVKSLSSDQNTVRVSGKYYELRRPARLTLREPGWRQYLTYDQDLYLSLPAEALLPEDDEERVIWDRYVQKGWERGMQQAEREMAYRIERLGEDFNGMLTYMRLVQSGQIEPPFVSTMKQDVVGDNNTMRLDERVYRISIPAKMVSDASEWNPLYGDDRDSLVYPAESQVLREGESVSSGLDINRGEQSGE